MMQKRQLGKSEFSITPLMFGGNVFGWTVDEKRSFELMDAFVYLGGDSIDTADGYSYWKPGNKGGESETIIGAWLKQSAKRNKVMVTTKGGRMPNLAGASRKVLFKACEDSLRRLGVDRIDLYQIHIDDPATSPDEQIGALADLQREGKIKAVGLSNYEPARLEAMIAEGKRAGVRIETFQPLYNLMAREIEKEIVPICVREQISIIPFYALAEGYLTGKYRTAEDKAKSARGGGMDKYMQGKGPAVLVALDEVGARHDAKPAQVALAWLMAKPGVGAPIASATTIAQLEETMGALRVQLSAEDVALLDKVSA